LHYKLNEQESFAAKAATDLIALFTVDVKGDTASVVALFVW